MRSFHKVWPRLHPAASGSLGVPRLGIRRGVGANYIVEESAPPIRLCVADSSPPQSRRGILRSHNENSRRGFSIIELTVVVGITALVGIAVIGFAQDTLSNNRTIGSSLFANQEGLKVMRVIAGEIRSAGPSAGGAYPLATLEASDLTFFSDSDGDGEREQIRYHLSGDNLQKDVIHSFGNPPVYNGTPVSTTLVRGITATSTAIFTYYDSAYAGTTSALSFPVDPQAVRLIRVSLSISRSDQLPIVVTTQVSVRSLKDNL